jgi:hypothetical protein
MRVDGWRISCLRTVSRILAGKQNGFEWRIMYFQIFLLLMIAPATRVFNDR